LSREKFSEKASGETAATSRWCIRHRLLWQELDLPPERRF
jgi:hypothetical protein